ncbi:MAG: hypothetical protein H6529_08365 [Nocardioides sp.]|nr:hypothetical protein [Nocardioidaceae bacterium]MCB8956482.1 hypothetical protein [Nocardioides sp.]
MTVRGRLLGTALGVACTLALAGCGSASQPSPPAGVDELVVPTPSPDPSDFVAKVDNPWFPLAVGSSQRYVVADTAGNHDLTVSVAPGPTVAGVATTARTSRESGRRVTDWYAQDEDGNVWWFGRAGQWQAGTDGAEAGLAMPATPRVGDGYRTAFAPGVVEDTVRVVALDEDQLVVEERSDLRPGVADQRTFERGTGLVQEDRTEGSYRVVRLVG